MKRAIAVVVALLAAGCSSQQVITAEEARGALPMEAQAQIDSPQWSESALNNALTAADPLNLPRPSLLAAESAVLSKRVNVHVVWTLGKIALLAKFADPVVDGGAVATWGPHRGPPLGQNEYQMTVTKTADKTYTWKLEGRPYTKPVEPAPTDPATTPVEAAWATLASGTSTLGSKGCIGNGEFKIDFDAAVALTDIHDMCKLDDPLQPTGSIAVKYAFTECEVPADDGGTTPEEDGGTTTPDDGGTVTPDDGGTVTPDDGGTVTPDDGGTTTPDAGCTDPERCPNGVALRKTAAATSGNACHIFIHHGKKRCCIVEKMITVDYVGMTDPRDNTIVNAHYEYLNNKETGGHLEVVVENKGTVKHTNYRGLRSDWNANKDGTAVKVVTKPVKDDAGTATSETKTLTQCWDGHGDRLILNLVYQLSDPASKFDKGEAAACFQPATVPGTIALVPADPPVTN